MNEDDNVMDLSLFLLKKEMNWIKQNMFVGLIFKKKNKFLKNWLIYIQYKRENNVRF